MPPVVLFLAHGTRGDVQPLVVIALKIREDDPVCRVSFITHSAHQDWLEEFISLHSPELELDFIWLSSLPARIWTQAEAQPSNSTVSQQRSVLSSPESLAECLQACLAGFGFSSLGEVSGGEPRTADRCHRLLIYNLFALEGFHIAEALGVKPLAVSPCLVPYAPPASFERRFQAAFPQLYHSLQSSGPGMASWRDVDHWCWPLFTERWARWRQERLGLRPVWEAADSNASLPHAPTLLYGLSRSVVDWMGYWPAGVHLCGYWLPRLPQEVQLQSAPWLGAVTGFLGRGPRTVCVDFGSMGKMGCLPNAAFMVDVLVAAMQQANMQALLLTGGWEPLAAAAQQSAEAPAVMLALSCPVPHGWLLQHCAVLLHHGGAGTAAAGLAAGIPHLVCPLQFDQNFWAEKLRWIGAGSIVSSTVFMPPTGIVDAAAQNAGVDEAAKKLTSALLEVQSEAVRRCCVQASTSLREEDGVGAAVTMIWHELAESPASISTAGLARLCRPQPLPAPPAGVHVTLPNQWVLRCSSPAEAHFIYQEIFEDRCYAQGAVKVAAGGVVVDVGANIGLFTLWALSGQGGGVPSTVWAFEALPPNVEMLRQNLASSGGESKVHVKEFALGARAESDVKFTFYPKMPGNSTRHPIEKFRLQGNAMASPEAFSDAVVYRCPVATLSEVLEAEGIGTVDLLKVDVELDELAVLQGIEQRHWPRIKQVVVEVPHVEGRIGAVKELLLGSGFHVSSWNASMLNSIIAATRLR